MGHEYYTVKVKGQGGFLSRLDSPKYNNAACFSTLFLTRFLPLRLILPPHLNYVVTHLVKERNAYSRSFIT